MIQTIIDFFTSITGNDYLTLYVISIIPIIELRGAIVFMSGMFDTVQEMIAGMFCCVAGSTTVILPLIILTRPLIRRMKKSKWFSKIAKNMEATLASRAESAYSEEKDKSLQESRAQDSNAQPIDSKANTVADSTQATIDEAANGKRKRKPMTTDTKKFWGLFIFVAIPLPMTGAWTASCIGSFLDFPVWKAALAVFLGNIVAGTILTIIAYFLQDYADMFLYGFVVLAIAIAVILYFTRSKRVEKQRREAIAKFGDKNIYELDLLKKEAGEDASSLIKKEYIDENGDRHIIIGRDAKKNESVIDDDKVI